MEKDNKALYSKIIDFVKERILYGEFAVDQPVPTENELAKMFNVSRITSRRALIELEREGFIYRKRKAGSFVSSRYKDANAINNASRIIAIVFPFDAKAAGMLETVNGATDVLTLKGYYLTVVNSSFNEEKEINTLKKLVIDGIAGIIYYPSYNTHEDEFIVNLSIKGYPIVTIDKHFENIPLSYVVSDNFNGGYMAAKHLIDLGHKRIAFISEIGINECSTILNRYLGYCTALKDNGIEICDELVKIGYKKFMFGKEKYRYKNISIDTKIDYYKDLVKHFLSLGVTAIQAVNDINAILLEKACLSIGVKIPHQLSIVGFDNIDITQHIEVPISTVQQDFYKMGSKAAEIVIEMIDNKAFATKKEVLPVELVSRQTTAVLLESIEEQIV